MVVLGEGVAELAKGAEVNVAFGEELEDHREAAGEAGGRDAAEGFAFDVLISNLRS